MKLFCGAKESDGKEVAVCGEPYYGLTHQCDRCKGAERILSCAAGDHIRAVLLDLRTALGHMTGERDHFSKTLHNYVDRYRELSSNSFPEVLRSSSPAGYSIAPNLGNTWSVGCTDGVLQFDKCLFSFPPGEYASHMEAALLATIGELTLRLQELKR